MSDDLHLVRAPDDEDLAAALVRVHDRIADLRLTVDMGLAETRENLGKLAEGMLAVGDALLGQNRQLARLETQVNILAAHLGVRQPRSEEPDRG